MDSNQYGDLVELILDKKPEVQKQALMITLQYSNQATDRLNFKNTPIIINLMKLFGNEELMTTVLSLIIQYSQDEFYQEQLLNNAYIEKQGDFIKEQIINFYKSKQITDESILLIDLSLLALANLTQNNIAKESFLQLEHKNQLRCFNFKLFCNFYIDSRSQAYFKNFRSILLNITTHQPARTELIKDDYKMIEYFIKLLDTQELYTIQIIKNLLHEYENEQLVIKIRELNLFDKLINILAQDVIRNNKLYNMEQDQLIFYFGELHPLNQQFKESHYERVSEIFNCFLVLTNVNFKEHNITYNQAKLDLIMKQLAKIKDKLNEDAFEVIEVMYIKNIM